MKRLQPFGHSLSVRAAIKSWVAVCLLLATSCGGPALSLAPGSGGKTYDYEKIRTAWTVDDRMYKDFELIASSQATFISPTFLDAWFQEYQRVFKPLPADLEAKRKEWHDLLDNQECTVLALTTQKREWNNLASGASIWRLYLTNDQGGRVGASLITPINAKDVTYRHFFPQVDMFYDGYIVCFPKFQTTPAGKTPVLGTGTRWFEVELRSTVARQLLRWELD